MTELEIARRAFLDADPLDVPAYEAAQRRLQEAKKAEGRAAMERARANGSLARTMDRMASEAQRREIAQMRRQR